MADQDNDSLIPAQREAQRVLERMAAGAIRREAEPEAPPVAPVAPASRAVV